MRRLMSIGLHALNPFKVYSGVILGISGVFLTACAGGGSGGGAQTMSAPALLPPRPAFDAPSLPSIASDDPANTAEFRTNYGLQSINAHAAYARGVSGAGVTVALIDDGIDTNHPDLDDNINPLSLDIRTGEFGDLDTTETHGTQVAGIIAAERNGLGSHGVAYNADILAIRALDADGSVSDIVAGIDYARQNGARILNLSLTVETLPSELRQALDRAVDDGMLLVFSAGNNLATNPARAQLDALSNYATFASAKEQAIAVGAIDSENNLFFLSNRPGSAGAGVYLLAPGVDIVSTTVGGGLYQLNPSSNPNNFGVDLDASGTSFAAPHVAGAAAVLWEMFPNLTASEVADLLLQSAVDVGASGVDAISGHGIVDLGAATVPQGAMSISLGATSFEGKSLLTQSRLVSGPAFGDALSRTAAFEGGFVQDAFRRAYTFDFRNLTHTAQSSLDMEAQLRGRLGRRSSRWQVSPTTTVHFSAQEKAPLLMGSAPDAEMLFSDEAKDQYNLTQIGFSSASLLPDGSVLTLSKGLGPVSFVDGQIGSAANGFGASQRMSTVGDLVQGGGSFSWRRSLSDRLQLSAGYVTLGTRSTPFRDAVDHHKYELGLSSHIGENALVAAAIGRVDEDGSVLGLAGTGAFGGIEGASTHYLKLGARAGRGRWSSFATLEVAAAQVNFSGASLLSEFSTIKTSSFGGGVQLRDNLLHNDRVVLSVSQPVRVEQGTGLVDLATSIGSDDRLYREIRELTLRPSGRELSWHAVYTAPLGRYMLTGEAWIRQNPFHVRDAQAESAVVMTITSRF